MAALKNIHSVISELRVVVNKDKKIFYTMNGDISSLVFMHNAALHEILKLIEKSLQDDGVEFLKDVMFSAYADLIEANGPNERVKLLNPSKMEDSL